MKKVNISQVSTFFANGSYPIEFLLYFPYKINTKRLRRALKHISRKFWPAFGSYKKGVITEQPYLEEECYDENQVNEAFDPTIAQEDLYFTFGKMIPKTIPRLFYLKVLHYTNGTVLIAKMNHLVGDGYSYFYLLSVLAATTKRGNIPFAPFIIGALSKPKIHCQLHDNFQFSAKPPERKANYEDLVVEVMEVGEGETRKQGKRTSEKTGRKISTNDILSAQLLKLILKSKTQQPVEKIQLVIPVDMRRAVPELGQRYFGNALLFYRIAFTKEEVAQKAVEELAAKIREHFPERNRQKYQEFLETIEEWIEEGNLEKLRVYDPETEFLVTNLSRMPLSRLDFGSGPPEIIVPLTRGKSGAAILAQEGQFILQLGR
ncbi:MAG: hypothetical protein GF308_13530 [Candidatus Heimdallarchaeota archaeon]|nr:hypothetical protein [Candidatus Heimdallarchaeota archaeon]